MKKFMLVAIAATFALTFSAFTTSRPTDQLYYWTGSAMAEYNDGNECPAGIQSPCVLPVYGTLYTADVHDDLYIYKKNSALK